MSDRNVRNPADALANRFAKTEERLRALQLRTWPGAVRTAMEDEVIVEDPSTVDEPESWTALTSVAATPGRWVVFGHTGLSIISSAGHYDLQLKLMATDEDGKTVSDDNDDFNFHTRRDYQGGLGFIFVARPMTIIGHFAAEEEVTVSLLANNFAGDAFTANDSCLMLMPV